MKAIHLALAAIALGCGERHTHDHPEPRAGDVLPAQSVTIFTPNHELFMEYAPLVAGTESAFAAHVTVVPGFKPASSGTVAVELRLPDGATRSARADGPKHPGIFRPALTPERPGACAMIVTIERDGVVDAIEIPGCTIYPDLASAKRQLRVDEDAPGRITYLKEQAWNTEFATIEVGERDLQSGVRANGEIKPVAGKEARLTAVAPGRVVLSEPAPILGMPVAKGQVLATLSPRLSDGADPATLEADVQAARAESIAADAQLARAERLHAEQAIPEKQLEEARARATVARARLDAAVGRQAQQRATQSGAPARSALQVRAPIDGTLTAIEVTSGQSVREGDPLFTVIHLDRVWLEARVFESEIPLAEGARAAWFTIDGYDTPFSVDESNGRVVAIGRVIDPRSRTVPVIFEVDNRDGRLRIGQFAKVELATGAPRRALALPESAVIDDAGTAVAYVQVEGESFERRPLALGMRARGWVEVVRGVSAGERVVSRGAHEIKLASVPGSIPAHGHEH